jgi:hypothetical protein
VRQEHLEQGHRNDDRDRDGRDVAGMNRLQRGGRRSSGDGRGQR